MKSTNPVPARFARTLCLLALLPLAPAYALSTDKDQPIHVEANSVEIDDRKGISIYQGDGDDKHGSINMTAAAMLAAAAIGEATSNAARIQRRGRIA